jgi:hypothetical protein
VPWSPAKISFATCSATSAAPIGMPDPIALPTVTRSGVHPNDWKWNERPVRPRPHWISSAMSRVPVALVTRAIAAANSGRKRTHAAFALDRFGDHRCRLIGHRRFQSFDVIRRNKCHSRNQGTERLSIVRVGSDRERTHRSSREAVLERDVLCAVLDPL